MVDEETLEVKPTSVSGRGVFAKKEFAQHDIILKFSGPRLHRSELRPISNQEDDRYLQIGRDEYICGSGGVDDYINHSCSPSAGVRQESDDWFLVALRDIDRGEEITFDYSTMMDEDEWEMDCLCGSNECRTRIRDFKYLPNDLQQRYVKLGIVPPYNANYTVALTSEAK